MKLSRGIKKSPVRAVIYSPEGRGKSSLASLLPSPVFIDVEGGTYHLDVARFEPSTWQEVLDCIVEIGKNHKADFKTVVFDTADWLERLASTHICQIAKKDSVEDFGYGKGYVHLCEEFAKVIKYAERLIATGFNVVFLAHSRTVKVSPPDQTEGYTKYEITLHNSDKQSNLRHLKEWADMILFINDDTRIVKGGDGKAKATGGVGRVIHCVGTAAFDAKNRYELPDLLPFEKGVLPAEIAAVFTNQPTPTVRKPDEIPGLIGDDTEPTPVPPSVLKS